VFDKYRDSAGFMKVKIETQRDVLATLISFKIQLLKDIHF